MLAQVGLVLGLLGAALALAPIGLAAVGYELSHREGYVILILAVLFFVGALVALFWPWIRQAWSWVRRDVEVRQLEAQRDEARAERDALREQVRQAPSNQDSQPGDEDLKRRSCELSVELQRFLAAREEAQPRETIQLRDFFSQDPESKKRYEETTRYNKETMAQYHQEFGVPVVALFDALEQRGWCNPKERNRFENPVLLANVRYVAQRLGAIGQRL